MDRRARLRPKDGGLNYVYGDSGGKSPTLLTLLRQTGGVVWNYTPVIKETRQVNYETLQPVHTNSGYNNYRNTNNTTISVQGTFYAGTGYEAVYLMACIHFFRTITLMDFGRIAAASTDPSVAVVGAPPPVLLFSAYGRYIYNDIPVIVKNVSFSFPDDCDYVQVPLDSSLSTYNLDISTIRTFLQNIRTNGISNKNNMVYVPQKMTIDVQLEEQPSPQYMTSTFNLNSFKRGELLRKGGFI
jgi:hypothetical protein